MRCEHACGFVKVATGVQDLAASHSIVQSVHIIEEYEKDQLLQKLLGKFRKNGSEGRIMVFVLYKKVRPLSLILSKQPLCVC